LLYSPGG